MKTLDLKGTKLSAPLALFFLSRPRAGNDIHPRKTPIRSGSRRAHTSAHCVHVLAAMLALSIFGAGPAQAQITFTGDVAPQPPSPPTASFSTSTLMVGNTGTGTLAIGPGGTVTDSNGYIGNNGGSSGTVTVTGPGSTWTNSGDLYVGNLGSGTLTIQDNGLVQVGGTVYIAAVTGSTGTLNIGAAPGSEPAAAGTLETSVVEFLGYTGIINFNHTATDYVFAPAISGPGTVNVLSGTTILSGDNTYTGGTTISAGTLQIGNGGTTGSITGNVSDNGILAFDRSDSVAFVGAISGTGGVTQIGTGTTILTGTNTYSGAANLAFGTLQAGSSTAFSANSAFNVASVLDLNGFNNTIGSLFGNGTVTNSGAAAILTVGNNNTNTTFGGILIDGIGKLGLTKTGTGTLILMGANTYSGGTTISAGTLQLGYDGTSGRIVGNVADNCG